MNSTKAVISDYVVRPIESSDLNRAIDIWSLSFGFMDRDRWSMFYDSFLDTAIGAYLDDYLVSVAGITNFQMWLGEQLVPCAGVSAVAADPAHRRRGLVRKCLAACLEESHRKRVPLTALWPFSYPFYRRMGYEVTDLQYIIEVAVHGLPDVGDATRYRRLHMDHYEPLKPIHEQWIKQSNLSIKRGDLQWRRLLSHPERQICAFLHDDGYILWNIKDRANRTLDVFEWAWVSDAGFLDGIALLKRMDDLNFDRVRFRIGDLAPLLALGVPEPVPAITVKPGMMTRVLHTEAFVEALGKKVPPFLIDDPLGVSESYKGNGDSEPLGPFTPGEVIQAVTDFHNRKPASVPEGLYKIVAGRHNFTSEFF
ncbi:MAG: GNAT family N-acetyltransferase [Candidatus Obscuribacterales bacterium]|nr:GNAT family N-acetyltransferase [Candidatus Obscuribacterales bacterium]